MCEVKFNKFIVLARLTFEQGHSRETKGARKNIEIPSNGVVCFPQVDVLWQWCQWAEV
jgi:hypothetical protein